MKVEDLLRDANVQVRKLKRTQSDLRRRHAASTGDRRKMLEYDSAIVTADLLGAQNSVRAYKAVLELKQLYRRYGTASAAILVEGDDRLAHLLLDAIFAPGDIALAEPGIWPQLKKGRMQLIKALGTPWVTNVLKFHGSKWKPGKKNGGAKK